MSDLNTQSGNNADLSEFKKLQKRLNHEGIRQQFRTKVVGGLNEDDVTEYILNLEDKLKKLESDNKKVTDEIFTLKTRLNSELCSKDSLLTHIDELKQDLNTYIETCNVKDETISSIREKANLENTLMKSEINQISETKKALEKSLNEALDETNAMKTTLMELEQINGNLKQNNDQLTTEKEEIEKSLKVSINEANLIKANLLDIGHINEELKQKNNQLAAEKEEIEIKLNASANEIEFINDKLSNYVNENQQLKAHVIKLENNNNVLIAKISELSEENTKALMLNEEKTKMLEEVKAYEEMMSEEIKAYEELLNQAIVKYDELKEYENENISLKERITKIEKTVSERDYTINEINKECSDLKYQLEKEKSSSEQLNMDLVIFKQKIIGLQDTINSNLAELDEYKKKANDAEIELNMEKAKVLNYKINGFKDEFNDIYQKLANLEFEAKQSLESSTILQQQLTIQKNRADKAEYDLGTFMEMVSGVKDKFYNERDNLGEEFAQLFSKQMKPQESNELLNNSVENINEYKNV